ncbi:MAG: hypothetical protein U0736_19085 [Gemmataceae bacterium]
MKATAEATDFNILIADDDRLSRETLRDIIQPEGYHTLLASSGKKRSTSSVARRSTWCCWTCTCRS